MVEINNEKVIKIPDKNERLAEFVGIMLGDGNITKYKSKINNNCDYSICIAGNYEKDFDYLTVYVSNLIIELFNTKPPFYRQKNTNGMKIYVRSKRLVLFLESIGLVPGHKKRNNVKIPDWIFSKKEFMTACLRGLIDTDGCVCPLPKKDYPCIWFKSAIPNLRESFDKLVSELGIIMTNWTIKKNTPQIYIYRKEMVIKYIQEIGFSNLKHKQKLNKFDLESFKNNRLSNSSVLL
ncbi:hypothetical protein J4438_02135 [Candidatus Woesearchaeota archaeon]|nr:hypothetical protein [Candidatus Woesearchaeota archaeon]